MRALLALIIAALLASPAAADDVRARAGGSARGLTHDMASKARCLVAGLEAKGARILFMGGWRRGTCRTNSKHPCGLAIDVCQLSRGVVDRRCSMPGAKIENDVAARCGLFHGARWCNGDRGHFEAAGSTACGQRWRGR